MTAYYNEIDPYAAQWLRNLIDAGHIARGDVDERSIADVRADDLRGYTQAHFFAGIGGWSIALRLAGWPDDRPVWTGSCPCQPFSAAGAGKAADDERHLWPAWFSLIAQCGPPIVFGEQVEAAVGWGWLDAVFADLEGEGYACGATVLPACSVGAPHIRQRLWFMADAGHDDRAAWSARGEHKATSSVSQGLASGGAQYGSMADAHGGDASPEGLQRGGQHRQFSEDGGAGALGNATVIGSGAGLRDHGPRTKRGAELADASGDGLLANTERNGGWSDQPQRQTQGRTTSWWSSAEWIECADGKARPIRPGVSVLAHGIRARASKLRAYGNAIVPQVAAEFIKAMIEVAQPQGRDGHACGAPSESVAAGGSPAQLPHTEGERSSPNEH